MITRVPRLGAAIGAVLVVWTVSESLVLDVPPTVTRLGCIALALAVALPTLAIPRWPVAAALLVALAYLANLVAGCRPVGGVAAELILGYALFSACAGRTGGAWRRWAGVVIGAAGFAAAWVMHLLGVGELETASLPLAMYMTGVIVAGVGPGVALRDRRGQAQRLRAEVEILEATVPDHVDEAVEAERDRLDISLSRVVTRLVEEIRNLAAEAQGAFGRAPDAAAGASSRMVDVSATAGARLREMVGTLHAPPSAAAPPAPAERGRPWASLADVAALCAPWILLAAFGVADQLLAPDLPLDVSAWGISFHVDAPLLGEPAGIVLAVLTPLALVLRRRVPAVAVGITMAFVVARTWQGDLSSVTFSQTFIGATAAYVGAAWARSRREALLAGALALGGTAASWVLEDAVLTPPQYAYMAAALGAAWGVGWALRGQVRATSALRQETARLAARREELGRRAVADERRRVARELHDVIGHGLSLISVQAGAAQVYAERGDERAHESLAHVQSAAGTTLSELQTLRGLLADPTLRGAAPLPAIRRLLDDAAVAGQSVRAEVDPGLDGVPAAVGAVAVRVVQEALTNARKHAAGSPAEVAVHVGAARVLIRVETEGGRSEASASGSSGHGLAGMAERVEVVGGLLEAGPSDDGGWLVRAELPLAQPAG